MRSLTADKQKKESKSAIECTYILLLYYLDTTCTCVRHHYKLFMKKIGPFLGMARFGTRPVWSPDASSPLRATGDLTPPPLRSRGGHEASKPLKKKTVLISRGIPVHHIQIYSVSSICANLGCPPQQSTAARLYLLILAPCNDLMLGSRGPNGAPGGSSAGGAACVRLFWELGWWETAVGHGRT